MDTSFQQRIQSLLLLGLLPAVGFYAGGPVFSFNQHRRAFLVTFEQKQSSANTFQGAEPGGGLDPGAEWSLEGLD
jgi:hypothetical protein